ncbi:hypothetical protein GCM10025331_65270 [Actinoplanes utahensis]
MAVAAAEREPGTSPRWSDDIDGDGQTATGIQSDKLTVRAFPESGTFGSHDDEVTKRRAAGVGGQA